jgi:cupin 2 domain-containing protein
MHTKTFNMMEGFPPNLSEEIFETILESESIRIERIISNGQATPEGEWFNQEQDEWVMVLSGSAGLLFDGDQETRRLGAGDYILIPAGCRHRVEWTDPSRKTVWLAVHFTSTRTP